jgi:hypothetical protein
MVGLSIYHGETLVATKVEDTEEAAALVLANLNPKFLTPPFHVLATII